MSSGRHAAKRYRGRHSARHAAPSRVPGVAAAGLVLPVGAALALAVTATDAAVAGPQAGQLSLTSAESLKATSEASAEHADSSQMAARRTDVSRVSAALISRQATAATVSRDRTRKAIKAAAQQALLEKAGKHWVPPMEGMKPAGSRYGMRLHPVLRYWRMHYGNDYTAAQGTELMAMSKGKVTYAGWAGGAGMTVQITYWDGTVSYYEHMSRIDVKVGQAVLPSEVVGLSGSTGLSTGPHLHLEIHPDGKAAVDPSPWFAARGMAF